MLANLKQSLSDVSAIRDTARLVLALGDDIRPIIQTPIIHEFIGPGPFGKVLDAGCGRGLYTRYVLPKAESLTAVDFAADNVSTLRRRLAKWKNLTLLQGSITDLPLEDRQFDLVMMCEVLEHIDDDRKALSEIARVIKPGGRFIISVPVPPAPEPDPNHVREGYTFEELSGLLAEFGFSVVRHRYCWFDIARKVAQFEGWWNRSFHMPMPTVFLLPVYIERFYGSEKGADSLPYDVIVEAKKID
jgi:SAM-dependent methyltransferase